MPVLSLGVLYVFAVLPVAVAWGLAYAIPVSVASMLAFNFFFLPPTHTFALRDNENWFALAVYLVTAVVVSELAARARRRAVEAEQREREAALLAQAYGLPDTRAVFFAFSAEEADRMKRDWLDTGLETPLEVVEAPFRDIGTPLLAYLRELTADPDVAVAAVMPEIVVRGWSRLLHNQRALYVKRLLLFEPRVLLTSVPYQLFR